MSTVKYLLDEHVPVQLVSALARENLAIDVLWVGQPKAPPESTPDPELLIWAEENGYALVTLDKATMRTFAAAHLQKGGKTWGIFILRPGFSLGKIAEALAEIWGASQAEEWGDLEIFVPFS